MNTGLMEHEMRHKSISFSFSSFSLCELIPPVGIKQGGTMASLILIFEILKEEPGFLLQPPQALPR